MPVRVCLTKASRLPEKCPGVGGRSAKRRLRAKDGLHNGKRVGEGGQTGGRPRYVIGCLEKLLRSRLRLRFRLPGPQIALANVLFFLRQRLTDVADEARMRCSAKLVVLACFTQAQFAVYGGVGFGGAFRILAIIFPPADRTKLHRIGCSECARAAARAAKQGSRHSAEQTQNPGYAFTVCRRWKCGRLRQSGYLPRMDRHPLCFLTFLPVLEGSCVTTSDGTGYLAGPPT